jgi:hypothetical protein
MAYREEPSDYCSCMHHIAYHCQLSSMNELEVPRILKYIGRRTRPWTKIEIMKLFNDHYQKIFDSKDFGRSKSACVEHWIDITAVIFRVKGRSCKEVVESMIGEFHANRNQNGESSRSRSFSQTEASHMVIQYLNKAPLNSGLNISLDECETYAGKLLVWIAEKRGLSITELFRGNHDLL